ncbi:AAA family ATPase [Sphingomonas sp. LT1P40]|uniref:AAA family ATPase n=1 Tax=Alteristakelama amylovorans TaxID=3096166 RepID=UPI002FC7B4E6
MLDEHDVVRAILLRIGRDTPGTSPLAKAVLGWARPNAKWLLGKRAERLNWRELRAAMAVVDERADVESRPLEVTARLAEALCLGKVDARVLIAAVAMERCPRARGLSRLLLDQERDLAAMLAEIAGVDPHAIRRCQPVRLGLVRLHDRRGGGVEIEIGWTLERLLDRPGSSGDELLEIVVGPRQQARIALGDFGGQQDDLGFLVRLLRGAVAGRAEGVNILIHGPPGTGKTELARTLAGDAAAALYSVGEADEDGDEPTRWDRVTALRLAQRMLATRGQAALLFDEMEDMIGDAGPSDGDWMKGRQGSKLWVNRMIETNPVPVIWTTNAVGNIDPAILRRMSFVLRLDPPSARAAAAMIDRIAGEEGVAIPESVRSLAGVASETASVMRVAARAGRLGEGGEDVARVAASLVGALRRGEPVRAQEDPIDLDLFEADRDIPALFAAITASGAAADVSLLLTGPPGTGKTGLAGHLARTLDRPLIVKRASDLLSKWVGGTEENIADAFREAERREGVLLFDEADSILFDRSTAKASWEVTQVNELLTWLDRHPLPFVAATNHAGRLDPAALRRFVFKLDLGALSPTRAVRAFERFFGMTAPAGLAEIAGLTPGDFAVVKRQLRFSGGDAAWIVERLRDEVAAKPCGGGRIGF